MIDLEEATLKHVNNVNSVVESEMNRFERVISAVEKHQVDTIDENSKAIDDFRVEMQQWKFDQDERADKKQSDMIS